jgi:ubiquitin carboxyl-terminal hydrolase 22/27/51
MTWTHAHHLAGYEQQDAHEFFIATLDLLHNHLARRKAHNTDTDAEDAESSQQQHGNNNNCDCIVDTIFTGKLQSDVVCQVISTNQ